MLKKNGRKCKQSELCAGSKTEGEMEVNEGEQSEVVGVVNFSEPEACTEGQDKDESVIVEVKFLEKVDPCLLADPFVVSGAVESVRVTRSGLVIIVCVFAGQREKALCINRMEARKCELFCFQEKGAIERID